MDTREEMHTGIMVALKWRSLDSMWYHLGLTSVARSTIAYANEHRPSLIYESLFYAMLEKCQVLAPKKKFSFQDELRAIDSTTIDLCLSLFFMGVLQGPSRKAARRAVRRRVVD